MKRRMGGLASLLKGIYLCGFQPVQGCVSFIGSPAWQYGVILMVWYSIKRSIGIQLLRPG